MYRRASLLAFAANILQSYAFLSYFITFIELNVMNGA